MDLKTAQAVRAKLTEMLQNAEMSEDVVVTVGKCNYGDNNAAFKLEVSSVAEKNVLKRAAVDFKTFSLTHGLPEGLLFQELLEGSVVLGYNRQATKMPIIIKRPDGREYRVPLSYVRKWLPAGIQ